MFAVIAAAAPARAPAHGIGPRAIARAAVDPPRLPSGLRSMRIGLRRLAPDAGEPSRTGGLPTTGSVIASSARPPETISLAR